MSRELRDKLIDALIAERPDKRKIVNDRQTMFEGDWDQVAYSYQCSFEVLWDHAMAQGGQSSIFVGPLMMLWRQSVELTIKAAIRETTRSEPPNHHELTRLFDTLLAARKVVGCLEEDDNAYTDRVRDTVVEFQKVDERADRFRYPTGRDGTAYPGFAVDIKRLLQAHWLITNWCDAASLEAEHFHAVVRAGGEVAHLTTSGLRLKVRGDAGQRSS